MHSLKSYECSAFMVFFNLWGNGGPDFIREFRQWEEEEQRSWTFIGKKKSSTVPATLDHNTLTGANRTSLGPKIQLQKEPNDPLMNGSQKHLNHSSSTSSHRPIFLHWLSAPEKEDLHRLIVEGFDFYSIQEYFRLAYPRSVLDQFSKEEEQDLKFLLSSNLSQDVIGELFSIG